MKPREGSLVPSGGVEASGRSGIGIAVAARVGGAGTTEDAAGSELTCVAVISAGCLAVVYAYRGYDGIGGGVDRVGLVWHR